MGSIDFTDDRAVDRVEAPVQAVIAAAWRVGLWCDAYDRLPGEQQQRIYDLNRALRALPAAVPEEEKPDA